MYKIAIEALVSLAVVAGAAFGLGSHHDEAGEGGNLASDVHVASEVNSHVGVNTESTAGDSDEVGLNASANANAHAQTVASLETEDDSLGLIAWLGSGLNLHLGE
jgi:hypothetical protein